MTIVPPNVLANVGNISVTPLAATCTRLEWRPNRELQEYFCPNFSIVMRLVQSAGSTFLEADSEDFIRQAFHGGIGILAASRRLPVFDGFNHHALFTIFQKVQHSREYSSRRFLSVADLRVKDRSLADQLDDVLPRDLGVGHDRRQGKWSISRLLTEGRALAKDRGFKKPNVEDAIRLGFLAAAVLNPLEVDSSHTEALVRSAFFALPPSAGSIPDDTRDFVWEHFAGAMHRRLDTLEQFDSILNDSESRIIREISKRKAPNGQSVDRALVRTIILELGWQSFLFCGECIDVQMKAFEVALPDSLATFVDDAYRLRYYCQSSLGKLPLVMLENRAHFVQQAIQETLDSRGTPESFAVLHRMLDLYGQLIANRRCDDSNYQRRLQARNCEGTRATTRSLENSANLSEIPARSTPQFREVGIHFLVRNGVLNLDAVQEDWHLDMSEAGDQIEFEITSNNETVLGPLRFPLRDLQEFARG